MSAGIVDVYKHLGVYIGNKPDWAKNTQKLARGRQSRIYLLSEDAEVHQQLVENAEILVRVCGGQCYPVCCGGLGGSRLRAADADRLSKPFRKGH